MELYNSGNVLRYSLNGFKKWYHFHFLILSWDSLLQNQLPDTLLTPWSKGSPSFRERIFLLLCLICRQASHSLPAHNKCLINVCEKKIMCKYLHPYFLFLILHFSYENSFLWRVTFALVQCHSMSFMVAGVRNPFQSSLGQRVAFLDWHNWKVWSTLASNTPAFRGSTEGHQSSVSFF